MPLLPGAEQEELLAVQVACALDLVAEDVFDAGEEDLISLDDLLLSNRYRCGVLPLSKGVPPLRVRSLAFPLGVRSGRTLACCNAYSNKQEREYTLSQGTQYH